MIFHYIKNRMIIENQSKTIFHMLVFLGILMKFFMFGMEEYKRLADGSVAKKEDFILPLGRLQHWLAWQGNKSSHKDNILKKRKMLRKYTQKNERVCKKYNFTMKVNKNCDEKY